MFCLTGAGPREIYTLSLHDALPIWLGPARRLRVRGLRPGRSRGADRSLEFPVADGRVENRARARGGEHGGAQDRKSTRLNSSHMSISYAVFCLKKKKTPQK